MVLKITIYRNFWPDPSFLWKEKNQNMLSLRYMFMALIANKLDICISYIMRGKCTQIVFLIQLTEFICGGCKHQLFSSVVCFTTLTNGTAYTLTISYTPRPSNKRWRIYNVTFATAIHIYLKIQQLIFHLTLLLASFFLADVRKKVAMVDAYAGFSPSGQDKNKTST